MWLTVNKKSTTSDLYTIFGEYAEEFSVGMAENASDDRVVKCPVCACDFDPGRINAHLDECLQGNDAQTSGPPSKKPRSGTTDTRPSAVFSVFQPRSYATDHPKQKPVSLGTESNANATEVFSSPDVKPECPESPAASSPRALRLNNDKPLAEVLRPSTLDEYFGQNKLLGEQTLLRPLLLSQDIPSLILWGPPGCGKVSGL